MHAQVYSGSCGENLTWTLYPADSTLIISGSGDMRCWDAVQEWHEYREYIVHVFLPLGLTCIGDYAFYDCPNLNEIQIPVSVTFIGRYAFENCRNIKTITLPNGVTRFEYGAFQGCSGLESINMPTYLTEIQSSAFYQCSSLTSINIPRSVFIIGDTPFCYCRSLTEINVASDNPYYCSVDGVLYDKPLTTLISCPGQKQDIVIPDGVTIISDFAFSDCQNLRSVVLPDGLIEIGWYAFGWCPNLNNVVIPNSVVYINESAFHGCSSLSSIILPDNDNVVFGVDVFTECGSLPTINGIRYADKFLIAAIDKTLFSYSINPETKWISNEAFRQCNNITTISIPSAVISVGDGAFEECTNLFSIDVSKNNLYYESVDGILYDKSKCELIAYPAGKSGPFTIPSHVTKISKSSFQGCVNLSEIHFHNGITNIEWQAFRGCTNLTSVEIPSSVTQINHSVFWGCNKLQDVVWNAGNIEEEGGWSANTPFYGADSIAQFIVGNSVEHIRAVICWGQKISRRSIFLRAFQV